MSEKKSNAASLLNALLRVMLSELVIVFTILLSVYAAKLFFKDTFTEIKAAYCDRFFTETDVAQVLE